MNWIACNEHLPPRPETPYKVYLVWVIQEKDNATGDVRLHQFDREADAWLPLPLGPAGVPQVVTHWCSVLDELGSPAPQPYGPRGRSRQPENR